MYFHKTCCLFKINELVIRLIEVIILLSEVMRRRGEHLQRTSLSRK